MKENKYDDSVFFEKYSNMNRSKSGLSGAGEWEALKGYLPDFEQKRVLDLGCGFGWHCIYAQQKGAKYVLGVDISSKMIEVAKQKTISSDIEYLCSAFEDIDFKEGSFEVVLSWLALHYVQSFENIVKKVNKFLTKGGTFVFCCEHPIFTSYGSQDWYRDEDGKILHFPVDNYFYEGKREAVFLGEKVVKYHKTLTTYLNTLLENGLEITNIVEPKPDSNMFEIEGMKDEMRRPIMLMVSSIKK